MQCPNCQHWNEAGSRFCEECGVELTGIEVGGNQAKVSVRPVMAADVVPPPAAHYIVPSS